MCAAEDNGSARTGAPLDAQHALARRRLELARERAPRRPRSPARRAGGARPARRARHPVVREPGVAQAQGRAHLRPGDRARARAADHLRPHHARRDAALEHLQPLERAGRAQRASSRPAEKLTLPAVVGRLRVVRVRHANEPRLRQRAHERELDVLGVPARGGEVVGHGGLPAVGDDLPSRVAHRRVAADALPRHAAVDLRAGVGVLVEGAARSCAWRAHTCAPPPPGPSAPRAARCSASRRPPRRADSCPCRAR